MKKQSVTMLALICVLAASAAGYAGVRKWNESAAAQESLQKEQPLFLDISSDEVTEFSYRVDGEAVRLKKGEDGWSIEGRETPAADEMTVDSMLGGLSGLRAEETIENPDGLSQYGLDEPRNIIIVKTKNEEIIIKVGNENELTYSCYVMKNGSDAVYTVSSYTMEAFDKTPEELEAGGVVPETEGLSGAENGNGTDGE